MNLLAINEDDLYSLVEQVVARIKKDKGVTRDKWISGDEAMQQLRISSKTTLQKLRDEGKIRFTQPLPKLILYDSESIDAYLEKHSRNTF